VERHFVARAAEDSRLALGVNEQRSTEATFPFPRVKWRAAWPGAERKFAGELCTWRSGGKERADVFVCVPVAAGLTDEGELGALLHTDPPARLTRGKARDSSNNFNSMFFAPVAYSCRATGPSRYNLKRKPGYRAPSPWAGSRPARFDRESTLARSEGSRCGREASPAAKKEHKRVPVRECMRDEASLGAPNGQSAGRAKVEPGGELDELAENDLPVRAGELEVERVHSTCIVHGLPVEVDQNGAQGARDARNEVEEDGRERARFVVPRVKRRRPPSSPWTLRRLHGGELRERVPIRTSAAGVSVIEVAEARAARTRARAARPLRA
jgi:hypothetical protein